jgi:hypothetical protein
VDDVSAIGQEHIGNGALLLVEAVCLEGDRLAIDEYRGGLFNQLAVGQAFLRAGDAAEADTFGVLVAQDFEGVASGTETAWAEKSAAKIQTGISKDAMGKAQAIVLIF